MPKESVIRKKVIDTLSQDGWICWYPFKARYAKEVDIFGVFDVIAIHPDANTKFIQVTNYANISNRRKKIEGWVGRKQIDLAAFISTDFQIWGWNPKKKEFRIVTL